MYMSNVPTTAAIEKFIRWETKDFLDPCFLIVIDKPKLRYLVYVSCMFHGWQSNHFAHKCVVQSFDALFANPLHHILPNWGSFYLTGYCVFAVVEKKLNFISYHVLVVKCSLTQFAVTLLNDLNDSTIMKNG